MIPQRWWWWWWWWFLRREEDAPPSSRCDGASSESESTTASRTCVDGGRRSTKRSLDVLLCDEDKGRHLSLPPKKKKKKKKSLCLGFSHLGFRFVCLFLVLVFSLFGFFCRSFVENPLSSSRQFVDLLTQAAGRRVLSREKDDAGSSSFVVVGVFVLRFVCRANADGGDRHVFCSVVVFIHARHL